MNRRILLPVFVAAAVVAMAASGAQAGLFGNPACCEPAACEPACAPACNPCAGLFQRLRARMASCCAPA
ncbi:MAG TPA: hypothetical protein VMY37_40940, partial [Thermoguttaceae bacterium]|nr:hypothetical protein [Thermoguttaceae bacterium]